MTGECSGCMTYDGIDLTTRDKLVEWLMSISLVNWEFV